MNQLFLDEIEHRSKNLDYLTRSLIRIAAIAPRFDGLDLSDVSTMLVYTSEITFYLKDEAKSSRLPHKLAQHFGVKFTKSQSYDKASLMYTGKVDFDDTDFTIVVSGAVPVNCTVEYIEEAIPENEIVRTRKKAIINCVEKELQFDEEL